MKRNQPIMSERSEFIGCSVMSLELQKLPVSANEGSLQLPSFTYAVISSGSAS
jgi:hypothetical protein